MNFLVPQVQSSKEKNKVTKNLSLVDILVLLIFLVIGAIFVVFVKPVWLLIILVLIDVLLLGVALVPFKKRKGYLWIGVIFRYLKSTKLLTFKEPFIDKFKISDKFYTFENVNAVPIRLNGANFGLMTDHEVQAKVTRLNAALIKIPCSFSFYKLRQKHKYNDAIKFWDTAKNKITADKLKKVINQYSELNNKVYASDNFYLVIYFPNKTAQAENLTFIFNALKVAELRPQYLNKKQIYTFITNAITPTLESKYQKLEKINIKPNHLLFNDRYYTQYISLERLASQQQNPAFFQHLFNLDRFNIVINVNKIPTQFAVRDLDKAISKIRQSAIVAKKSSESLYSGSYLEQLEALQEQVALGNDNLMQVNIIIEVTTKSLSKLKSKVRSLINELRARYNVIKFGNFEQRYYFDSYIPVSEGLLIEESNIEMPLSSLAGGYPFLDMGLYDEQGVFIGHDNLGNSCAIDFWKRDEAHVNSNTLILGKSGSGKSFFTKRILLNQLCTNNKVYLVDPESEYKAICKNVDGKYLDLGAGGAVTLNPLQILILDEAYNNVQLINNQINLAMNFIELLCKNLDHEALLILKKWVKEFYIVNYHDKNIVNIKASEYKTFSDLYSFVDKQEIDSKDVILSAQKRSILLALEQFTTGSYSHLWNKATQIDITNDKFYCFDLNALVATGGVRDMFNAQIFLMLNFLTAQMVKTLRDNKGKVNPDKFVIVIDEAHLLIDAKNLTALDFLADTMKRIRKYNGMIIAITQNINDFMGDATIRKQAQAIINNAQYSFIFNLNPADLNDLNNLYKSKGGLNQEINDYIASASRGECFAVLGNQEKLSLTVQSIESERELIG